MSANFYNTSAALVGLDLHPYWIAAGPIPVPGKAIYLMGAWYHAHAFAALVDDASTVLPSVTADGWKMIQGSCKLKYIPHGPVVPIPPGPPHPVMEAVECGAILLSASSVPLVRRQSVTGRGKPLACCIVECVGVNLDCADPLKTPTGGVIAVSSVKTSPSLADLADAAAEIVIDALLKWLFDTKLVKELIKRLKNPVMEALLKEKLKDKAKEVLKDLYKWLKASNPSPAQMKALLAEIGAVEA